MAELWSDSTITDAVGLYLRRRPGGAVIVHGSLYQGPNQCNGTIEHMNLVPDGEPCYCGQRGCMDPYCSLDVLLKNGEQPEAFFRDLHAGDQDCRLRFDLWLDYVALSISSIRSLLAVDIIVGGTAARFFDDDDFAQLKRLIIRHSALPSATFTLRASASLRDQDAIGGALRFIQPFLDSVFLEGA